MREGLLTEEEAAEAVYPAAFGEKENAAAGKIDYAWLYNTRELLLRKAYERWKQDADQEAAVPVSESSENARGDSPKDTCGFSFEEFCEENKSWLPDYALFMALKKAHGGAGFMGWEEPLRLRDPEALETARRELADEIDFQSFLQYQFERQWTALKAYANRQGISIIGDIPIYVPADSAEVWAYPELFQLHEDGSCKAVAGCPPDGFSAVGQRCGTPLYDWKHHAATGFAWWTSRMRRCSSLFDIVRIDHFRGFDQYYAIPADSADARIGQWEDGPGIGLFRAIEKEIPGLTIIAEDLGYITESVRQLVRDTGYPNMKVLEFAFDSRDSSGRESYLPYNYEKNCVVYTGTHDNETLVGWLDHILPEEREEVRAFTGLDGHSGDPWAYDAPENAGQTDAARGRSAPGAVHEKPAQGGPAPGERGGGGCSPQGCCRCGDETPGAGDGPRGHGLRRQSLRDPHAGLAPAGRRGEDQHALHDRVQLGLADGGRRRFAGPGRTDSADDTDLRKRLIGLCLYTMCSGMAGK